MSKKSVLSDTVSLAAVVILPLAFTAATLFTVPAAIFGMYYHTARSASDIAALFTLSGRQAMQHKIKDAVSGHCAKVKTIEYAGVGSDNPNYAVAYSIPEGGYDEGQTVALHIGMHSVKNMPVGLKRVPASSGTANKEDAIREVTQACERGSGAASKFVYLSLYPDALLVMEQNGSAFVTPVGRSETLAESLSNFEFRHLQGARHLVQQEWRGSAPIVR